MSTDLPALLGGTPVRPHGPPAWPTADSDILDALRSTHADCSWGQYLGPHVPALEALLAEVHGVPHAVTCSSGTLAVEVALRALGVGPGDEVVLGAYDYEPNFLTVHHLGAAPVVVDISPVNGCLDPSMLESAIGPRTKAILVSHLHGGLVPMSQVMETASRLGTRVVEDTAQVSGATVEGRPAGSWGDVGVLSFGGSKLLTAGRGGALLTRHADVLQRARLALARGVQQWAALSQLQAAVLIPQVRKLPEMTALRHERVNQLVQGLRDVPGLIPFRNNDLPDSRPAYFKLGFFLDEEAFGVSRDMFVKAVRAEGIAFDPGFRALHVGRTPSRYKAAGPLLNAETAGRSVVCLHHPVLSLGPEAIEEVVAAVRRIYRNATRIRSLPAPE